MKPLFILTSLVLTGSFAVCAAAQPTPDKSPWTLWSGVDGSWVQDAYLDGIIVTPGGETAHFDPGARLDIGIGYNLTTWLQVGVQTGIGVNGIRSLWDIPVFDGLLVQAPVMGSLTFEPTLYESLSGLARVSGGGLVVNALGDSFGWSLGGGVGFPPVYELAGGLIYRFEEEAYLGLIYRYTETGRLNWTLDWVDGMVWPFEVHGLRMHSVGLEFAIKF